MTDKEKIREEVERLFKENRERSSREGYAAVEQLRKVLAFIDSLQEEPVSNDLEEAIKKYLKSLRKSHFEGYDIERAFEKGAQWQKEQMEKNRIAHCDNITEEQYNLETGFLDDFLDKNKRMPTFLDAIEYGMKKAMEDKL